MEFERRALELFPLLIDAKESTRAAILAEESDSVAAYLKKMLSFEDVPFTETVSGAIAELVTPPSVVGDFRLLSVLGEGGMGVVYLAEQALPRRRVAVKLLRPHLFGPQAASFFRAEIETLAMLSNPGLPWLIAAGETDGWLWFAMERIQGERLDQWAKHATAHQRRQVLIRLARVVGIVHARGIAHLDLKPANVMITPKRVVVLDLGIARIAGAVGLGAGTPGWQAPEQINSTAVDLRSDVYTLGRLGLSLLSPDDPLSAVLARATAGDPAQRYDNASALADALEYGDQGASKDVGVFLHEMELATRGEQGRGSAAESVLRRLIAQAAPRRGNDKDAYAIMRSLMLELDDGALDRDPDSEARLRLLLLESLQDKPDHDRQLHALLALLPEVTSPYLRARAHLVTAANLIGLGRMEATERHIQAAEGLLPIDHPDRLQCANVKGQLAYIRGDLEAAERFYRQSCAADSPSARCLGNLAAFLGSRGQYAEANHYGKTLLRRYRMTHGEVHFNVAVAHNILGQINYTAGHFSRAVDHFTHELELMNQTAGPTHIRTASCRKWLGASLQQVGRSDEALTHIRAAVELQADEPFLGTAVQALARVLVQQGEMVEAEASARRAVALYRERLGPDFRELPRAQAILAQSLAGQGRREEARKILAEVLPRLQEMWGAGHPRVQPFEAVWASLN